MQDILVDSCSLDNIKNDIRKANATIVYLPAEFGSGGYFQERACMENVFFPETVGWGWGLLAFLTCLDQQMAS